MPKREFSSVGRKQTFGRRRHDTCRLRRFAENVVFQRRLCLFVGNHVRGYMCVTMYVKNLVNFRKFKVF